MENNLNNIKAISAIIIASFLWGTTGTAASYSTQINPLAIGAFSMGVGGLLLAFKARNRLLKDSKKILNSPKLLLLGSLSIVIYPLAFYTSMQLSGVAIGTIISIASAPLFAALLERLISKKAITQQWLVSFLIGAIGIALLTSGKEVNSHDVNVFQQSIGIVLGLIAGLSYASYSWVTKRLIEKGIDSQASMSGLFGIAALLLLPSLWFTGENLFSGSINIGVSLYLAIVPTFIGYVLFAFGLKFVEASKATLITLIEPLIATLLAVLIIGEKFKISGWVGAVLVSLCLLIQTLPPKKFIKIYNTKN